MKVQLFIPLICFLIHVSACAQKAVVPYDLLGAHPQLVFKHPDSTQHAFLHQLKTDYQLQQLVEPYTKDLDKVLAVLHWTHRQWKHNGSNQPSNNDALTILQEAKTGKQFRCVEYGIVVKTALQSLQYHARVLGLKTRDVETRKSGAGHVLAEVWMPQFKKWVLIDGQFNIMPILNGIPLHAVELQQAIATGQPFQLIDHNGEVSWLRKKKYLSFIGDYLYYLDTRFDTSPQVNKSAFTHEGKTHLMLVPLGAKQPTIFQIQSPLTYCYYTHSLKDFYQAPNQYRQQ